MCGYKQTGNIHDYNSLPTRRLIGSSFIRDIPFTTVEMRTILICALALFATVFADEDATANLLVSKVITNRYLVQGKDLTVEYNVYNIGDGPAYNVMLRDASFAPTDFQVVKGLLEVKWDRIAAGGNVTHAVILMPARSGWYNFTSADVTYQTAENTKDVQIAYSSYPGEGGIASLRDYEKVFSPHIADWAVFALMTVPTLAFPYFLWLKSHQQYTQRVKRN